MNTKTTKRTSAKALEALRRVDFSQQAYRGYLIRTNAFSNTMWVEQNGQRIFTVPADKSWEHARREIDEHCFGEVQS